jgi:hypothetical protein
MPIQPSEAWQSNNSDLETQAQPWYEEIDKHLKKNAVSLTNGGSIERITFRPSREDMSLELAMHIQIAYRRAGWTCSLHSNDFGRVWFDFSYTKHQR